MVARDVALTTMPTGGTKRVLAALRDIDNQLTLVWYDVNSSGKLSARASYTNQGEIQALDMDALNGSEAAVALRAGNGALKVQVYALLDTPPQARIILTDADSAGAIEDVTINAYGASGFATLVRTPSSALKLITWEIDGGVIARRGDDTAGVNKGAALVSLLFGSDTLNRFYLRRCAPVRALFASSRGISPRQRLYALTMREPVLP